VSNTVRPEEFGRDLGVVHEAVITGRKVGADAKFWAMLAHDEEKFRELVAFASGSDCGKGWWFPFTTTTATLIELRERNPDVFEAGNDWWLDQPFANEKGEVASLQLWTSILPGSLNKSWHDQRELLLKGEFVPTTRDLIEGTIACYRIGKRLFSYYWVRCHSCFVGRVHVSFHPGGLNIHVHEDNFCGPLLGLSVARSMPETRVS